MAEATELSNLVHREIISSCQKDNKLPLKWAWFGSRDPLLRAQLEKFRHGTPLTEINDADDDGPVFVSSVLWWSLHPAGPAPRWLLHPAVPAPYWLLHLAGFAPNEGTPSGRQWMFTAMDDQRDDSLDIRIKEWLIDVVHLRTSLITALNDDQRPGI